MFALKAAVRLRTALRRPAVAGRCRGRGASLTAVALAVVGLVVAEHAAAIGLGRASGQAILGQPLRIEIPLLGTADERPAAGCFSIRPPQQETDAGYALKGAHIELVGEPGRRKLRVTTATAVREPVVEFGVSVACGFDLTKDYLLLSSLPDQAVAAPQVSAVPPVSAASLLVASDFAERTKRPAAAAAATASLRIDADTTLAALAQRNYPLQPKAREKYVRMMREANPELDAERLVAAGTQLRVPPGLPVRREGRYRPAGKAARATATALPAPAQRTSAAVVPPAAAPSRDVLRLGAAPERSPAELLDHAERLAAMLMQQTRTQDEITESLTRLESAFKELKQHHASMAERMARIEAERLAEKAAQSHSLGVVELLLAVLVGGALGGAGLHIYKRRRPLSNMATQAYDAPTVAAYLGPDADVVAVPVRKAEKSSLSFIAGK